MDATRLRTLRRIAREARNTYVGRHWPTMEDMRRDGIGLGLGEDRQHERFIRRFIDTFQPDFVLDLLDELAAPAVTETADLRAALDVDGLDGVRVEAPHVPDFDHDDGCAYAYGNLTYPCYCLVARSSIRAALAAQRRDDDGR